MTEAKTIDDIFAQIGHFKSKGNNIVVTHPVVRDMTDDVLNQKWDFDPNAELAEGTRYFGFFDSDIPNASYLLASSKTSCHQARSDETEQYEVLEQRRNPFDKIAQRQLCEEFGIFKNPRYLDIRKLFTDAHTTTTFRFVPEDFTGFPIEEIVSELGQNPHSYIFHNMTDGFRIRNSKNGGYTISGKSDAVKKADAETKGIEDPHQRLEAFLEKLTEKGFALEAVGYKGKESSQQEDLINGILSHKGNLYIKDARSGGGYLIVRVKKEEGKVHLECDSPDLEFLIEKRKELLKTRQVRYDYLIKSDVQQIWIDSKQKLTDEYDPNDPKGILYDLLITLGNPIIEEEISYETFNGHRAEFRLICQRVPEIKAEDETFEIKGYAKVSSNGVTANISLGGHGEPVRDVLRGMYKQRIPEMSEDELSSIVDEAEKDIMTRTKDFAEKVYSHYASNLTLIEAGIDTPRDFAIDLIPVWDNETGRIDYCFLEINHHYGYKGLREVDRLAAYLVYENKQLIKENKEDKI